MVHWSLKHNETLQRKQILHFLNVFFFVLALPSASNSFCFIAVSYIGSYWPSKFFPSIWFFPLTPFDDCIICVYVQKGQDLLRSGIQKPILHRPFVSMSWIRIAKSGVGEHRKSKNEFVRGRFSDQFLLCKLSKQLNFVGIFWGNWK